MKTQRHAAIHRLVQGRRILSQDQLRRLLATQRRVTGSLQVHLLKGSASVLGRSSLYSLYSGALATFEADDVYRQANAGGFISLFGLPVRVDAQVAGRRSNRRLREVA